MKEIDRIIDDWIGQRADYGTKHLHAWVEDSESPFRVEGSFEVAVCSGCSSYRLLPGKYVRSGDTLTVSYEIKET